MDVLALGRGVDLVGEVELLTPTFGEQQTSGNSQQPVPFGPDQPPIEGLGLEGGGRFCVFFPGRPCRAADLGFFMPVVYAGLTPYSANA